MKFTLVVMFLMGGEWTMVDGWYPREQPSYEVCMERARDVALYIGEHFPEETAAVSCTTTEDK